MLFHFPLMKCTTFMLAPYFLKLLSHLAESKRMQRNGPTVVGSGLSPDLRLKRRSSSVPGRINTSTPSAGNISSSIRSRNISQLDDLLGDEG